MKIYESGFLKNLCTNIFLKGFSCSLLQLQQFKKEVASNTKVEEETDELKKIKKVATSVGYSVLSPFNPNLAFPCSSCKAMSHDAFAWHVEGILFSLSTNKINCAYSKARNEGVVIQAT